MSTSLRIAAAALALGLSAPSFAEDSPHTAIAQAQTAPTTPTRPMQPGMGQGGPGMMGQRGTMGPGMMGQGMMDQGGMPGVMPMTGMMQMMRSGEHIEGRLAFLKAELKITDSQEKAWSDFADAARKAAATTQGAHMGMRQMSGAAGDVTLPQLLDRHQGNLEARLEATRAMKAALDPLYAALDEQQKQTLMQLHPMLYGIM